jgi:hypothetical protein
MIQVERYTPFLQPARIEPGDDGLAIWLSVAVAGLALSDPASFHWFLIPTVLCGALIGGDAIRWFSGKLDAFDPVGLMGIGGFFFFFLAPILHTMWGYWMAEVAPPPDWREWLGRMAVWNALGLVAYRVARSGLRKGLRVPTHRWMLRYDRFVHNAVILLVISLVLQLWVYSQFGGLGGYIQSFEKNPEAFEGLGIVFILSESFPIILLLLYAVWSKKRFGTPGWVQFWIVIPVFCLLLLFFGGLRGSRSHTLYGAFWAVGIFHIWLRPIPRKAIVVGFTIGLIFAYMFGFYKSGGLRGLTSATDPNQRAFLEQKTGRTVETLLLGDLGRSDVQAYVLYRLSSYSGYSYAWGKTYLGSAALLLPKEIFENRPPSKLKWGTELHFGISNYDPHGGFVSTRVYGLAGEAMLNFGPLAIPVAFWLLGRFVRRTHRWKLLWANEDSRYLLVPLTVILCYVLLTADSDNVLILSIQYFVLPFFLLRASSSRVKLSDPPRMNALSTYR